MKGQISFDLLLSIIIFMVIIGLIFSFINDLDKKNDSNIDFVENYNTYLSHKDYLLSTSYYSSFYKDYNVFKPLDYSPSDCSVSSQNGFVIIGSTDNNFSINSRSVNYVSCNNVLVFK